MSQRDNSLYIMKQVALKNRSGDELKTGRIARVYTDKRYDVDTGDSKVMKRVKPQPNVTDEEFFLNDTVLITIPGGKLCNAEIWGRSNTAYPDETEVLFKNEPESTCFLAGTLIETITGEVEIEKIKSGDYVLGYNEKISKIVQCLVRKLIIHNKEEEKVNKYYVVKTENSEVRVTLNHPFFRDGDYKQIQQITDYIYLFNGSGIIKEKIISKQLIRCSETVTYNLSLDPISPCNYFANNYLVHNVTSKS